VLLTSDDNLGQVSVHGQNISVPKQIDDKTHWQQSISATKRIGDKTHWRQNTLAQNRMGDKTSALKHKTGSATKCTFFSVHKCSVPFPNRKFQ
jgi:hypothetical protein